MKDQDHGNCEKCDNYRCRRGISMKSKNTEKRLDYISQVASMKSQNWGDYGWLVSEEWENIPVDIQTRIQTILRRDFIEKEVNSIKE